MPLNEEYTQLVRAQRQKQSLYRRGHLDGSTALVHRIRLLNGLPPLPVP